MIIVYVNNYILIAWGMQLVCWKRGELYYCLLCSYMLIKYVPLRLYGKYSLGDNRPRPPEREGRERESRNKMKISIVIREEIYITMK